MKISDDYANDICALGQGAKCCRYLALGKGWECMKLNPTTKTYLDERVKAGTIHAQGDNCEGMNNREDT